MKKLTLFLVITIVTSCMINISSSVAQKKEVNPEFVELIKPYHPEANAQQDIDSLVNIAKKVNKNIIIQAGGNWCIWCLRFNNFIQKTSDINTFLNQNFLYYHLNYSPENKNENVFNRYAKDKGKEFGYPFFIILNNQGKVLTTRASGDLEEGKGYDKQKVMSFFNAWLPQK